MLRRAPRDKVFEDFEGRVEELRLRLAAGETLDTGYRFMDRQLVANWRRAERKAGQRLLVPLVTMERRYDGILNRDLLEIGYLDTLPDKKRSQAAKCLADLVSMTFTEDFYGDRYSQQLQRAQSQIVAESRRCTVAEVIIYRALPREVPLDL